MKHSLKAFLLGPWLGKQDFAEAQKELIRKCLASHTVFRGKLCGHPGNPDPDLSWRSGWPKSATEALFLVESLVYGSTMDGCIRTCLKANKTPEEMLDYGPVKEKVTVIVGASAKEKAMAENDGTLDDVAASNGAGATAGTAAASTSEPLSVAQGAMRAATTETWRSKALRTVSSGLGCCDIGHGARACDASSLDRVRWFRG